MGGVRPPFLPQQLHGSGSYRVPWNYDEEACQVLKFFTELKGKLMPYLSSLALEAHRKGIPVMRPMHMEFPRIRPAAIWISSICWATGFW